IDMRLRWEIVDRRWELVWSVLLFAPGAVWLGALAVGCARRLESNQGVRAVAILLILSAIAAPLALHVVGWARHRWTALSAFNAILAALLLLGATRRTRGPETEAVRPLVGRRFLLTTIVVLWGVASSPVFFDGYIAEPPPFARQLRFL